MGKTLAHSTSGNAKKKKKAKRKKRVTVSAMQALRMNSGKFDNVLMT